MPEEEKVETFAVVASSVPNVPVLYMVKATLSDALRKAIHPHFWFHLFALRPSPTQTENPWNGTSLLCVGSTHPSEAFLQSIRYAAHHLRDVRNATEQQELIERAVTLLDQATKPVVVLERTTDLPPTENMPL